MLPQTPPNDLGFAQMEGVSLSLWESNLCNPHLGNFLPVTPPVSGVFISGKEKEHAFL
jgi:hypothetical protein